ncbi:hypothetical protein DUI87_19980 [Hirundo rustica rustica]|uniref:Uncharacterized protein n=1 Tax=Hirundo rustica rustica TaxID=333673 RepID=A0A3M0JPK8_HIRRU|nr:hypothetical protein DUI87_19980 [Hirundo rustica rustica]
MSYGLLLLPTDETEGLISCAVKNPLAFFGIKELMESQIIKLACVESLTSAHFPRLQAKAGCKKDASSRCGILRVSIEEQPNLALPVHLFFQKIHRTLLVHVFPFSSLLDQGMVVDDDPMGDDD